MVTRKNENGVAVLVLALVMCVGRAHADGIGLDGLIIVGWMFLAPVLLFSVLVEGFVIGRITRAGFFAVAGYVIMANIASLVAGIPIFFGKEYVYRAVLPGDLPGAFNTYGYVVAGTLAAYFIVTVIVEIAVAWYWRRRAGWSVSSGRLLAAVFLANVATYAVLGPLDIWALTSSSRDMTFTRATSWASEPAQRVLYLDSETDRLMAIDSNGQNAQELFPYPIRDYIVADDLSVCVFRAPDGALYYARREPFKKVLLCSSPFPYLMDKVALSPDFRRAAFLRPDFEQTGLFHLTIFDSTNGTSAATGVAVLEENPILAWSEDRDILYARGNNLWKITFAPDGQGSIEKMPESAPLSFARYFGRLGPEQGWNSYLGQAIVTYYERDTCGDNVALVSFELQSCVLVGRRNPDPAGIGDHFWDTMIKAGPRFLPIFQPDRMFVDVAFLPNCKEVLFDDGRFIYLLDTSSRTVGTLARGHTWILLTDRYSCGFTPPP